MNFQLTENLRLYFQLSDEEKIWDSSLGRY